MIPVDLLRRVRKVHITTSRMVTDVFAGHYQSVFKGQGIEFAEVREYQPGDDIRSIDWNVTARMGQPYIKKFVNERNLTIMFLLDLSASCRFGTVSRLKTQLAAEICGLLAFSAFKNSDRMGLIAFTDRIERVIPPGKGIHHVWRVIRDALSLEIRGRGTDIPLALDYLNQVTPRRTVTFILSDFYARGIQTPLSIAGKRHDVVAISLSDPLEMNIPALGLVCFEDAETGKQFLVDTDSADFRRTYREIAAKKSAEKRKLFASIGVDHIEVLTEKPYLPVLVQFFRMREKRFGR
jgi:uncharacterized protein (DUF58 family)